MKKIKFILHVYLYIQIGQQGFAYNKNNMNKNKTAIHHKGTQNKTRNKIT